jgi:hypothetical protein
MSLFLSVIILAVVAGYLLGGRLRNLERLRLRYWWLAPIGLAVQALPLPDTRHGTDLLVRMAILGASYAMLIIFAAVNVRVAGMPLLLIGLSLNGLVVVADGGMPVSRHAVVGSGQAEALRVLAADEGLKHHLMGPHDLLTPLSDVIPIPAPIKQVASVGDVFVYAGLVWLIVSAMRGQMVEQVPSWEATRYRGKHRHGSARVSRELEAPPAEATTWGT